MATNIQTIEGIGPSYAEKLERVGCSSVEKLLQAGATRRGRANLAEETGLSETLLLKWVNMADLRRIRGVGGEFAELLEGAGVDTVKELRHRNAESLVARMAEVNREKRLTRAVPGVKSVTGWIEQAQALPPIIEH